MATPGRRRSRRVVAGAAVLATVLATLIGGTAYAAKAGKPATAYSSVAVYPTEVAFTHALRGGNYVQTIGVINGSPAGQWFHFRLAGAVAPWLEVVPSSGSPTPLERVWAPPGAAPSTAILELHVPAHLADGTYNGKVDVASLPTNAAKSSKAPVSVGLGAAIDVSVAVTGTEIVAGTLVNAYTYPKVEVGSAVRIFAVIKNSSNVTVLPRFHLAVRRLASHSAVYRWTGATGDATLPGQTTTYELTWPASATRDQALGKYVAELSATFPGGKRVGSWSLPLALYPYGSLHRGGLLLGLELANRPEVGYSAEVQAVVQSTGEVQQETNFVGALYRNGHLLEGVTSPVPVLLAPSGQPGDRGVITVPVRLSRDGLYRLTGEANFAGAQSRAATITFRAGPAPTPLRYELAAAAAALLVITAVVGGLTLRRRRRRPRPPARFDGHVAPRYTASHPRALHVPPRQPIGSQGPPHRRLRRAAEQGPGT